MLPLALSTRGACVAATVSDYPTEGDYATWRMVLRFWDTATGAVIAEFSTGNNNESFGWPVARSPDQSLLALGTSRAEQPALYLIDAERHALVHRVPLDAGRKAIVRTPAFSPDGRWIAIASHEFPDDVSRRDPDVKDLPQPRIHLVDAAAGRVREVLVAPQGIPASACFSPDGKMLATSGYGRVLLWDVADLAGARAVSGQSSRP